MRKNGAIAVSAVAGHGTLVSLADKNAWHVMAKCCGRAQRRPDVFGEVGAKAKSRMCLFGRAPSSLLLAKQINPISIGGAIAICSCMLEQNWSTTAVAAAADTLSPDPFYPTL